MFGAAQSVDFRAFWDAYCPDATAHQAKRLAYGFMLTLCLNNLVYTFKVPRDERLSVICEECDGVEGFATECFYGFKSRHGRKASLGSITFMPKASFRGLQAADMMAYEAFKYVTNEEFNEGARPVRKLLTALNRTRRLAVGYTDRDGVFAKRAKWLAEGPLPEWPKRDLPSS